MATLRRLDAANIKLLDVGLRRPTLDDVFLSLTGHVAEQDDDAAESPDPAARAVAAAHDTASEVGQ